MRWRRPPERRFRVREGFLFLPLEIGGEVRWLEWARWEQRFESDYAGSWWRDVRWLP